MIDLEKVYKLVGCEDQVILAPPFTRRGDINGFKIARGEADLPPDVQFVRGEGPCRADIIGTGFASLYLISSRLADELIREHVSGWRSVPVRFSDNFAREGAYHALIVTGRCGPVRYDMSDVVEKKRGRKTSKWWRGYYFDPSTWDGSDIFTPADRASVLFVYRVREMLHMYDIDGVEPMPLPSIETLILPVLLRH